MTYVLKANLFQLDFENHKVENHFYLLVALFYNLFLMYLFFFCMLCTIIYFFF